MITPKLQWTALVLGAVFLVMMIELIRKNRIQLRYSLLWLLSGVVMILLAAFPQLLDWAAGILGVYNPVNALFAVFLGFGLVLMISFSVILSGNRQSILRLTQELSLLERRVHGLEEKLRENVAQQTEESRE